MRPGALRPRVLWIGTTPSSELVTAHTTRQLNLQEASLSPLENHWAGVRAVLITPALGDAQIVHAHSDTLIIPALRHGAKVIVCAYLDDVPELFILRKSFPYPSRIQVFAKQVSEHEIAESIVRHDPGPPFDPLLEIVGGESLGLEEEILLRRAFHDCKRISLQQLPEGHTANVYCGYAIVKGSIVGPRPLPFFIKLGRLHKIVAERRHYSECANNYIPFYLRPNLDDSRFAEGYEKAVLVGNFVEHSEALIDVVRRGAGLPALSSLFENSLRGWRMQAYHSGTPFVTRPLAESMKGAIHGATKHWKLAQMDRRVFALIEY
jgi:hypothetical protein